MLDFLLNLKENIDRHGIRWGLALTLFALYRKERRNLMLDKRDEAIFHNQRIIMEHLGVVDQWRSNGQPNGSVNSEVQRLKRRYSLLRTAINRVETRRRRIKMNNQNINWFTLVGSLLGAAKLVLQPFGIDIPDQNINEIVNGVAALATVIGIILSHRKGGASNAGTTPTSIGPAK